MSNFRITGRWAMTGREFLVTLGETRHDCKERLTESLKAYSGDDVQAICQLRLERWEPADDAATGQWLPLTTIPMRGVRYRKAAVSWQRQTLEPAG